MYKLIKLIEGYIIISNEEQLIQENQYYLGHPNYNTVHQWKMGNSVHKDKSTWCKIVIASTFIPELPNIDFNNLEEEFGIINVEKLALENAKLPVNNHKQQDLNTEIWISGARQLGFKEGFNKCLELNKNKLYTEEDMKNCWKSAKTHQDSIRSKEYQINPKKSYSEFIQSLQPKTEFEVEVEHTCNGIKREGESCNKNNNCTYPNCGEIKINKI